MHHLVVLLALAFLVTSQNSFQERAIYLSERDCVCHKGQADKINLIFDIDGKRILKALASAHTQCIPGIARCENCMIPRPWWYFMGASESDEGHQVLFNEDTRYVYHSGKLFFIIQKTTIESAKLFWKDYNCTIQGDGTVQHWGVDFKEFDPATFYIYCTPIEKNSNIMREE